MYSSSLHEWWSTLSAAEHVFWAIAVVFTVLFIIQFSLMFIGGLDFDGDVDVDGHNVDTGGHDHGGNGGHDFQLISVRGIIAFFTFFGWTGIGVLSSNGALLSAIGGGAVAGSIAMGIVAYVVYFFASMQESGNLGISDTMYTTGEVYLTIPGNKQQPGKVLLKVHNRIRQWDAMTEGETLPNGTHIRVIDILNDELLLVEPVAGYLE